MRALRLLCGFLAALGLMAAAVVLGVNSVLPRLTGTVALVVQTPSMTPAIEPGDVVLVDPAQAGSVRRGDVVTYSPASGSEKTVTHRVIEKSIVGGVDMLTTKGDHNNAADTPIKAEQVRGKVVRVIPSVGLLLADRIKLLTLIGASVALGGIALSGRSRTQTRQEPPAALPRTAPTRTQELSWT